MTELSDESLLRRYCGGDRAGFDALFRRYAARVHATAYRLTGSWEDAEDTLQEVFVRLANKAGSIKSGASLSSWIYRTAVNCATDCLRRRRASMTLDADHPRVGEVIALESLRREAERQRSEDRESLLAQVEALIPKLPERQAAVFVLRHFQGLSHREIAAIVGCSEASSKSNHSLACRRLRELVEKAEAARERKPESERM